MQFPTSEWKARPNIEAAKKQVAPHPGTKHSMKVEHFSNARPEQTNYKQ